jgi:hypothetical protein
MGSQLGATATFRQSGASSEAPLFILPFFNSRGSLKDLTPVVGEYLSGIGKILSSFRQRYQLWIKVGGFNGTIFNAPSGTSFAR